MSIVEECLVALWQSEEIFTGAVREVKEETGVRKMDCSIIVVSWSKRLF